MTPTNTAPQSPEQWLRALGAKRPMAVARDTVLVLGEWCENFYPIEFRSVRGQGESWFLFGHRVEPLQRDDVVRILKQLKPATKGAGAL